MALPTNIDATYPNDANDPSVALHQQYHDTLHALYNLLTGGANLTFGTDTIDVNGFTMTGGARAHMVEFGRRDGTASAPVFDWHSSGNNIDYDVRINAEGGTTTNGQGRLVYEADTVRFVSKVQMDRVLSHVGTQVGFFNAAPVTRPTVAAAATDNASAITLINSIRTALIALGLVQ